MDIFVDENTPGAKETGLATAWRTVCHRKRDFLWIWHQPFRDISRWTHVDRKRPFLVTVGHRHEASAHETLAAAIKAARAYAKEHGKVAA